MKFFFPKLIWLFAIIIVSILFVAIFFSPLFVRQRKEAIGVPEYKADIFKRFSFSESDSLKEWEDKVFKGKVAYRIEKEEDLSYVKASSDNSAAALYYRIKVDAKTRRPVVRWRWKAERFPEKKYEENLDKENEDDFAARFYVIFPAMFITNYKVLEYVWAEKLPVGTTGTSPYSKNIKLIVLRSGPGKDGQWASEERDITADYIKMFGRSPEHNIGAIAFMTNTEHTGSRAAAVYDEIEVGYKLIKP